ncbi:MAG: SOS response-associated peptidase [Candidatus Thorarchaeota archaeon]
MCGRFTLLARLASLQERYKVAYTSENYSPNYNSYNVAPTQIIPTVTSSSAKNILSSMRWSFSVGPNTVINARDDKLISTKTYFDALCNNRCLIPADGFYEWKLVGDKKIPQYIRLKTTEIFSFAGIYQYNTKALENPFGTAILTTIPNDLVANVHNRMPVILPPQGELDWLNSNSSVEKLQNLLVPYPTEEMEMYQVSPKVNSAKNNSPDLIKPISSLTKFF